MSDTKEFDLLAVISAATGYLVSDKGIGVVYEVLSFVTGESVYTHQIPRVSREFGAALKKARPELLPIWGEAKNVTPENWQDYARDWTARFGDKITVPTLSEDEHERIDPLSELAEKVHPDRIILVQE